MSSLYLAITYRVQGWVGYVSGILHVHYYSKAQLISTCADPDGEEPEGEDPEGEEPEQPLHLGTGSLLPALHTFVPTDYSQEYI